MSGKNNNNNNKKYVDTNHAKTFTSKGLAATELVYFLFTTADQLINSKIAECTLKMKIQETCVIPTCGSESRFRSG